MPEDKLKTLYNNISEDYDLPEYDQFKADMSDSDNLSKLHTTLTNDDWDVPDLEQFSLDIGVKKKDDSESITEVSSGVSPEVGQPFISESNDLIKDSEGYTPPEISLQEQASAEQELPQQPTPEITKGEEEIAAASEEMIRESDKRYEDLLPLYKKALSGARESISVQRDDLNKRFPNPTTIIQTGDPEYPSITTNKQYASERDQLDLAEKYIDEVESVLEAEKGRAGVSAAKLRGKNFEDIVTLGWSKVLDAGQLKKVAEKSLDGKELTEQEQTLLAFYGFKEDVKNNVEVPLAYDVVGGMIDMVPYMANIAATGGIGSSVAKATGNVIKETSKKAIAKYAAKGANYLLGKSVQALAMPMTYEGTLERQVGGVTYDGNGNLKAVKGDDPSIAFLKSYGSTIAEIGVEGFMDDVVRTGKLTQGKGLGALVRKETKFGSFTEELIEEFVTAGIQAPIEGQTLEETFTPRMAATTILTISGMSGAMTALDYASGKSDGKDMAKNRADMEAFGNLLSSQTKKKVDDVVDKEGDLKEAGRKIEQIVDEGRKDKGWADGDVFTVMNYASSRIKDNSFNAQLEKEASTEISKEESKVEQEPTQPTKAPETEAEGVKIEDKPKISEQPGVVSEEKSSEVAASAIVKPKTTKEADSNIKILEGEKASLQESLKEVPEDQKSKLEAEISDIDQEIQKQKDYVGEIKDVEPPTPEKPTKEEAQETFREYPVGVTNSYTRADRISRGKDPLLKAPRQANKELWSGVDKKIEEGSLEPRREVRKIYEEESPAVSEERQAVILHDRVRIANEKKLLKSDIEKAQTDGDLQTEAALWQRLAELEIEQDVNDVANTKIGTAWGRTGRFRQVVANSDFTIEDIKREAKILNRGEDLTPKQEQKFQELADKHEQLQKEYTELQDKIEKERGEVDIKLEEARKEIEKALVDKIRKKKGIKAPGKTTTERGKELAAKIRSAKLKNQDFTFATIVPPGLIDGAIEVVAISVEQGAKLADAIKKGIKHVKNSEWYKNLTSDDKTRFETRFREHVESLQGDVVIVDDAEYQELLNKLIADADGEFHDGLKKYLDAIVENRVVAGIDNISDVVNDIYDKINEYIPGVTKRDIRDMISGYGSFRKLSKDEVDVKIRELKRQGRLDSSLEDVDSGKLPLRSGVERDMKTQETRSKERKLAQEIKDKNLVQEVTDQEKADQWRNAEEAYHRKLENAIEDVQKEIDSGEKRAKAKGVQFNDPTSIKLREELETLKALRDEAFKLPPKTPEQKRINAAISATEKAIARINNSIYHLALGNIPPGLKESVSTKDGKDQFGLTNEKKEPIKNSELNALKDLRESLKRQLSEIMPEGLKNQALLDKYKKSRERTLKRLEEQKRKKDFGPKPKKTPPPYDKETKDINRKISKVKEEVDLEKEKIRLANRTKMEALGDTALDIWNLSKVMMASVDLSAPFRQGIVMVGKPKQFSKAFVDMFRHAFSKEYHENWLRDLRETDIYYEMKENGLFISEPTSKLAAKEEQFMSNFIKYLEKIPIYGQLLTGSERAYVGFLNKLRTDVYANFKYQLEQSGIKGEEADQELKAYANFINHATGRGKLGALEPIAPILNGAFFSPRLISSRLNMVNPLFYSKLPPAARKDAWRTIFGFMGVAMTSLILADIAGGSDDDDRVDVEWDPRSSDFAKIRVGDKRYDLLGGFSQVFRTLTQFMTGQKKSTRTGEIRKTTKDVFPYETRLSTLWNFFKYKMSPSAALLTGVFDDFTTPVGDPITLEQAVLEKTIPLYLQDMAEIIKEEGVGKGITSSIPAVFGVGVQYYGTPRQSAEREVSQLERDLRREERNARQLERKLDDGGYEIRSEFRKSKKEIIKIKKDLRKAERELRRVE